MIPLQHYSLYCGWDVTILLFPIPTNDKIHTLYTLLQFSTWASAETTDEEGTIMRYLNWLEVPQSHWKGSLRNNTPFIQMTHSIKVCTGSRKTRDLIWDTHVRMWILITSKTPSFHCAPNCPSNNKLLYNTPVMLPSATNLLCLGTGVASVCCELSATETRVRP